MTAISRITLAELLQKIRDDDELTPTRRQGLTYDLGRLAKLLERSPIEIPADLRALKSAINDLHHAQLGISRKRLQNIRSSLMFVFRRYKLVKSSNGSLTADWASLKDQLQTKRERDGLTALFNYCSSNGIVPTEISDAISSSWCEWMETQTLRKKPRALHRQACVIWNELCKRGICAPDGSKLPTLSIPNYRTKSFTLPPSAFEHSFMSDLDAYCMWLSGKDLFALSAPPKPSKPSTIELRRNHILILASAAVESGFPRVDLKSLADLISEPCVRCAIGYYHDKLNGQYTTYVRDLTKALLYVARHWVRDEDKAVWIQERLRRMGSNPTGLTAKNRDTLRQFDDPHNIDLILALPAKLMEQASDEHLSTHRRAVRAQLAIAIELLTVAPMRLANLAQLRIDTHIKWIGRGKQHEAFISLPEEAVKNAVPLEYPLPAGSLVILRTYLEAHRPQLASNDSPWLFTAKSSGAVRPKLPHTLGQQMKALILKETGLWITPHQFRHIAAKLYLDNNPGNYEVVRRLLGHTSIKTTVGFYTGLETRAAVAHYDETLDKLRGQTTPRQTRRRRR